MSTTPLATRWLLIEIGRRISGCIREADTLARVGGDEFTILLPHLESREDAHRVAERIVEAVQRPAQLGEHAVRVGASVGISYFPDHGVDAEALNRQTDRALYQAKEAGRRGVASTLSSTPICLGDARIPCF